VTRRPFSDKLPAMIRLRILLLLAPLALVACSGSSTTPPAENVDSNGQPVSAVPWNKPENWETNGQLGNMQ
jgi:outer membrane biogenesis lipoprotein LolB